ncbi:MAG: hypothetical protein KAR47_00780, partial [Planctomycetes bacterium]|nr:hypothetical protein [Planctomycetota bacterium]
TMQMGDMPDLGSHLKEAYNKLKDCTAGQKHVIIISDGDPAPPTGQLLSRMKEAGITCTGVAVFPHSPADVQSLLRVAQLTGGRFYDVKDPAKLPQIFIKEAQVVRRALIVEETFSPQITYSLSEIMKGLSGPLPSLDGYVLTGPKGGLNQILLSSHQGDPILAAGQSGLGRCVAFTSSVDSRWASQWLAWQGSERLFEQMVRWVAKSAQARDCEITADVEGDQVNVNVEAIGEDGKFIRFANIDAQVIAPNMSSRELALEQVGPGQFRGNFQAAGSGSYIVNLRYKKLGADQEVQVKQAPVTVPFAPEFRDLSDNASLLTQVSSITGGRVLGPDPRAAMLFDYSGVKIPQTQLPLTRPLIFIWLVLFLLDVAVRRIAVDVKALWRKAVSLIRRRPGREKAGQTLDRLRMARNKVRDGFASRRAGSVASRRYQADERYEGDLPAAEIEPASEPSPKKAPDKAEKEKKQAIDEQSHIQQLLRAKKKAADRRKDKNPDDDK